MTRGTTDPAAEDQLDVAHTAQAREILGPDAFLGVEHAVLFESDPDTARAIAREHLHVHLNTRYNIAKFRRLGYSEDEIANGGSDGIEPGQSAMPHWQELGEALLPQRISA